MVAGTAACTCPACGTACKGKFGGCPEVWAAGPRRVAPLRLTRTRAGTPPPSRTGTEAAKPPTPAVTPVPVADGAGKALKSIHRDVAAVGADIAGVRGELEQLQETLDDRAQALDESVEYLRKGLEVVTEMVTQQQALLNAMAEVQAATIADLAEQRQAMHVALAEAREALVAEMTGLQQQLQADAAARQAALAAGRSPYERLVGERRARSLGRATEGHDHEANGRTLPPRLPRSPLEDDPALLPSDLGADRSAGERRR